MRLQDVDINEEELREVILAYLKRVANEKIHDLKRFRELTGLPYDASEEINYHIFLLERLEPYLHFLVGRIAKHEVVRRYCETVTPMMEAIRKQTLIKNFASRAERQPGDIDVTFDDTVEEYLREEARVEAEQSIRDILEDNFAEDILDIFNAAFQMASAKGVSATTVMSSDELYDELTRSRMTSAEFMDYYHINAYKSAVMLVVSNFAQDKADAELIYKEITDAREADPKISPRNIVTLIQQRIMLTVAGEEDASRAKKILEDALKPYDDEEHPNATMVRMIIERYTEILDAKLQSAEKTDKVHKQLLEERCAIIYN